MKKTYSAIIAAVCVGAFLGGILTGYLKNRTGHNISIPPENLSLAVNEEESIPREKNEAEFYKIKKEDEYICLYEIFSEGKSEEIQKMDINNIYLPESELTELCNGVIFYNREEALMVMESFSN